MTISTTDNVYAAMWAMLLAVRRHNISSSTRIRRVACGDAWASGTRSNQRPSRLTASVVACKLLIHSRAAAAARNGALSAQDMSTCGVGRYAFQSLCVG